MKNKHAFLSKSIVTMVLLLVVNLIWAQNQKVAILAIDGKGIGLSQEDITVLTRLETQKFDGFIVLDKYDVEDVLKANNITGANCFSTDCLIKAGELVKADLVLTGSINPLNNSIVASFRVINVANKSVSNAIVREYSNIPAQTQNQIHLTLAQLFNKPYDKLLFDKLKRDQSLEQQLIQPQVKQLNLSGPRMGATFMFGEAGDIIKAPIASGGFNSNPLMFQIGYQFEKQYLNSGTYQALFEIVPMITGIDQNKFIPSLSVIHGLRNNINGWEFGLGAVFGIVTKADMFLHTDNNYYLYEDWRTVLPVGAPAPKNTESRLNSKGDPAFMTAIILAVGKSFKSGNLNIPVAFYAMPQQDGLRIGLSVGFNSKNK